MEGRYKEVQKVILERLVLCTEGAVWEIFKAQLAQLLAAVELAHPRKVMQTSKDISSLFQVAAVAKPGFDKVGSFPGVMFSRTVVSVF